MSKENEKNISFKSPEETKSPGKPKTEEEIGLTFSGKKSQDMTRPELCELILILRGEQFDFLEKIKEAESRAKILREEMFNFMQSRVESMVKETISRVLAGLGIKLE